MTVTGDSKSFIKIERTLSLSDEAVATLSPVVDADGVIENNSEITIGS